MKMSKARSTVFPAQGWAQDWAHTNINLDSLEEHKTFRYLEDTFFTEKPMELGLFSLKEMTRGELCNGLLMHIQIL